MQHIPGSYNNKADYLSRLPMNHQYDEKVEEHDEDEEYFVASVRWSDQVCISEEEWRSALASDAVL